MRYRVITVTYVAATMMLAGVQKISRRKLAQTLAEARKALPIELGYVKDSVNEFVNRVEDRSSLLMMAGLDIEDGELVEFFEFRHLTFQEFLTARAIVSGWYSNCARENVLYAVLRPHLSDPKWKEVVPLAAVLGGTQHGDELLRRLTTGINSGSISRTEQRPFLQALGACLADEAPAHPDTVRAAIQKLVQRSGEIVDSDFVPQLTDSRYGPVFMESVARNYADHPTIDTVSGYDLGHAGAGDQVGEALFDHLFVSLPEGRPCNSPLRKLRGCAISALPRFVKDDIDGDGSAFAKLRRDEGVRPASAACAR